MLAFRFDFFVPDPSLLLMTQLLKSAAKYHAAVELSNHEGAEDQQHEERRRSSLVEFVRDSIATEGGAVGGLLLANEEKVDSHRGEIRAR